MGKNAKSATRTDMVVRVTIPMTASTYVPYFSAFTYMTSGDKGSKIPLGKIDEVLGPINECYFSIRTEPGIQPDSIKPGTKIYIAGDKLAPVQRFLPKPEPNPGAPKVKKAAGAGGRGGRGGFGAPRGRGGRGGRGDRGGFRGGRGGAGGFSSRGGGRGGSRGGFSRGGGFASRGRGGYRGS